MAIAVKGHQRGGYLPAVRRPGMMAGVDLGGHEDYSSPEQRSTDLLTWTLRPWLYPHRAGRLDAAALDPAGKFNAGALVRATLLDRYTAHTLGSRPVGCCAQRSASWRTARPSRASTTGHHPK
jgi:hypothetical protein